MPIPISSVLPFAPMVIAVSAVFSFIMGYFEASARTNPNHRGYIPPEKRYWRVFTLGDIFAWIYATLWVPVFLYVGMNIAFWGSDINAKTELLEDVPFVLYPLILTGPIGIEFIRYAVNKRL